MLRYFLLFVLLTASTSCSNVYYSALEKVGIPKRDLVVKRVEAARTSQTEASSQFQSALERFRSVVTLHPGDLEVQYNKLKAELDKSEAKAQAVHDRIAALEDVSEALFDEWNDELGKYKNDRLRRMSEDELDRTKRKYSQMITAMKRAESKIEPVLQPLRDNVLFLKHNLNARAIGELDGELDNITEQVDVLVRDLQDAVSEADRFIDEMQAQDRRGRE